MLRGRTMGSKFGVLLDGRRYISGNTLDGENDTVGVCLLLLVTAVSMFRIGSIIGVAFILQCAMMAAMSVYVDRNRASKKPTASSNL